MLAGIGYLQRAILSSLSQHSYTSPGSPCCLYVKRVEMWSHNIINSVVDFCHQAHLGVQVEAGSTLTPDGSRSRPADVWFVIGLLADLLLLISLCHPAPSTV